MLRNSSTRINAGLDRSDYGLLQPVKGPTAVANGLTGIKTRWSNVSSFSIVAKCSRGSAGVPPHTHKMPKG
jgi:hypothetical protein